MISPGRLTLKRGNAGINRELYYNFQRSVFNVGISGRGNVVGIESPAERDTQYAQTHRALSQEERTRSAVACCTANVAY